MGGDAGEMFFFDGARGRRLLGFLHPARAGRSRGAVLYLHPFAEERNLSHGVAVRTARKLAAAGYAVLRFDFSGCGDSEGLLEEATAEDWLAEISLAAGLLKERAGAGRLGLWGLRAGAGLAACWGRGREDLDFAALWQPVPDFKLYMTQFLRQKLASGLAAEGAAKPSVSGLVKSLEAGEIVEVMGYPVAAGLHRSLSALGSAAAAAAGLACPTAVFSISEGEEPADPLKRMAEGLRDGALVHVRAVPFWDRYWRWEAPEIEDETVKWITGRN